MGAKSKPEDIEVAGECLTVSDIPPVPSCGKELPNTHTKVEEENEDSIGNIYIWGRNIFMGYLSDHEDTRKMIDNQGWMHTGDLGFLDTDNFLYIMGSLKGE